MNFISNLFDRVKLEDQAIKELTHGSDTYGERVEIAKKIIEGGDKKEIHEVLDLVTKTILRLADDRGGNISGTNTAIAECAQVMVEIGPDSIDSIFKILDKQKNRPSIDLFPQTIQRVCCAALAAIGDRSALPRLKKYVAHIQGRQSDLYVTDHAREAVRTLEQPSVFELFRDAAKRAQEKK